MTTAMRLRRSSAGDAVDLVDHRLDGQEQVGAGVAVGHRVDVEVVDVVALEPEGGRRPLEHLEDVAASAHRLHVLDAHAAPRRPSPPPTRSTSKRTCSSSVRVTSARLSPRSITTCRPMSA